MARRARVEMPDSDALALTSAALSVVCGLALGAGAVAWLRVAQREPGTAPPRATSAPAPAPSLPKPASVATPPWPREPATVLAPAPSLPKPASAPTPPWPREPATVGPPAARPPRAGGFLPASPPAPPTAPAVAPALAAQSSRALELLPGRIAYVRCDGVEKQEGRFPCPRDRELERSVWSALRGLEQCAGLAPGRADIRLEFGRGGPPALHVLAPASGGLDRALVTKCTAPALHQVVTALEPDRMLVAFDVGLQVRP